MRQCLFERTLIKPFFVLAVLVVLGPFAAAQERPVGAGAGRKALAAVEPSKSSRDAVQTVAAAGDIVDCNNLSGSEATAELLDGIPGTVLALGDLAYPDGSDGNFDCYDKTWGRHKARTRPAPGNHEHHTPAAEGYFKYFGNAAGRPEHPYYSFNLGSWHLIALDSECVKVGGCGPGSPQERWLRHDLQRHPSTCILAFWHVPLFSSGAKHGNDPEMKPFWDDLYAAGADVVLNGHDHDYERFAPQDPAGSADPARGIREFVVGTGGKNQRAFGDPLPTSEARSNASFGVLRIDLHPHSYEWTFLSVPGSAFTDSGSGKCHSSPAKRKKG